MLTCLPCRLSFHNLDYTVKMEANFSSYSLIYSIFRFTCYTNSRWCCFGGEKEATVVNLLLWICGPECAAGSSLLAARQRRLQKVKLRQVSPGSSSTSSAPARPTDRVLTPRGVEEPGREYQLLRCDSFLQNTGPFRCLSVRSGYMCCALPAHSSSRLFSGGIKGVVWCFSRAAVQLAAHVLWRSSSCVPDDLKYGCLPLATLSW